MPIAKFTQKQLIAMVAEHVKANEGKILYDDDCDIALLGIEPEKRTAPDISTVSKTPKGKKK